LGLRCVLTSSRAEQVAELRVDDEVEAFGLQGTLAALNGTTMYVHRYDEATRQFSIAGFTREELQAVRDGRKHRLDTRKSGKTQRSCLVSSHHAAGCAHLWGPFALRTAPKKWLHHDPITGMTAYDTTGDGVADAYDTTGDLQIDTFLEEPVVKDAKEELWQVAAANLRKTPQHDPGDQVVVDGLVSVEGQTLNGLHGTVSPDPRDNALARVSSSLLRAGGFLQRRELRRQHR